MKQKWGREGDAGDFPSEKAVWTRAVFLVAVLSVLVIGVFRYLRVWTPLERHYLTTYVGTPVAGALRKDGGYTLLMVVTAKGSRMAIPSDLRKPRDLSSHPTKGVCPDRPSGARDLSNVPPAQAYPYPTRWQSTRRLMQTHH